MTPTLTITILGYNPVHCCAYVLAGRDPAEGLSPKSEKSEGLMVSDDTTREIVSSWGIKFRRSRPDLDVPGSSERTACRLVVEDEDGGLWVLEGIAPGACEHKQKISSTLALLHGKGLRCVHPCLALKDKESFIFHGNGDWQIRPYVEGFSLPRPSKT